MSTCDELLSKAKQNPKSLRFVELCSLAECWGYVKKDSKRKGGSHRKYKHSTLKLPMEYAMCNFQDGKGMAKPYQVRQLLSCIEYIDNQNSD